MNRKLAEATFHDKERSQPARPPNGAFYSVTRGSYEWAMSRFRDLTVPDGTVLDYCCGNGGHTRDMARLHSNVTGIDISPVSIENAKRLAAGPRFLVMDAEHTTFTAGTFDAITCNGVLHHLDLDAAYKEMARILKPGGRVFCLEPLAYNPLFQLYRRLTPGLRTEWERKHILTLKSIERAEAYGLEPCNIRYFHLMTLLAVPFRNARVFQQILSTMEAIDEVALELFPFNMMAWQVYFELRKGR